MPHSDQDDAADGGAFVRLEAALVARYRVVREIGSGGMATVYLADDLRHNRQVAVKVLRSEIASSVGPARFMREIEVAARLNHPNILSLLDSGSAAGFVYYVMPYIEGASLRDRIANEGRMAVADVVRIVSEVVDALADAHRAGIVHRDVKPDNVLLSGRHALVTDFGVARAVGGAASKPLTTAGIALGTPAYMAPEQAIADPAIDHRVDIYAVGVMMYEMLTGSLPFTGGVQSVLAAHMTADPPSVRLARAEIPAALDAIILKCLAKSAGDRWQTADELLAQLEAFRTPTDGVVGSTSSASWLARHWRASTAVSATLILTTALIAPRVLATNRELWVRTKVIPEIEQHTDSGDWDGAYRVAMAARSRAPNDPALDRAMRAFTNRIRFETDPAGATIWRRAYRDSTGEWERLGQTPVVARYPYDPSRLRVELPGYRSLLLSVDVGTLDSVMKFKLDRTDSLPEEMIRVDGGVVGRLGDSRIADFFLDRFEVTNAEYKKFVDASGYQRRELWQPLFEPASSWSGVVRQFVDRTGRPGPSTWELGDFPAGHERYPVSGVSWYEAAAYAQFVGKSLPTLSHWFRAYGPDAGNAPWTVPASNIERDGPAPVGEFQGLTRYGALDMAGNVREWIYNARGKQRWIAGGAWNDVDWAAGGEFPIDPLDRSPTNGIRLAKYLVNDSVLARALEPSREPPPPPDYRKAKRVSDDIIAIYRQLYKYDKTPLNARRESAETTQYWIRERITFDAAYGQERVPLYLYLPKSGTPPFQTVVYWPGSAAMQQRSIDDWRTIHLDFAIKSGRAFAFPIYKGTFERRDWMRDAVDTTVRYRDRVLQLTKDLARSLDYLSTRTEIDTSKFAYYGFSWGGRLGGVALAVEPRFKTAVLYIAGFWERRPLPEVDELNFVPHVKLPVLFMSGRFDPAFPLQTSAEPMFEMLGTPPANKRHEKSDGGHFVPRTQQVRVILDWLDRYLGPTR